MHEAYVKPSLTIQPFIVEGYFMSVSRVELYPQVDEYELEEEVEL